VSHSVVWETAKELAALMWFRYRPKVVDYN